MKRPTWWRKYIERAHEGDPEALYIVNTAGRQEATVARLRAEVKELRKFAKFVEQQLNTGPRTNGIDQAFCLQIGQMATAALTPKRKR